MDDKEKSVEIFNAINSRLNEALKKVEDGLWNPAYEFAFQIGIQLDIEEALRKIK